VIRLSRQLFAALTIVVAVSVPSFAQDDDDAVLKPAEPDFALLSLPTSLRLPVFKSSFRLTHRFGLALKGDFGDLAGDLFGLDDGATVGIEYRIGIIKNGQVGFHRSSSGKTALSAAGRSKLKAYPGAGNERWPGAFSPSCLTDVKNEAAPA